MDLHLIVDGLEDSRYKEHKQKWRSDLNKLTVTPSQLLNNALLHDITGHLDNALSSSSSAVKHSSTINLNNRIEAPLNSPAQKQAIEPLLTQKLHSLEIYPIYESSTIVRNFQNAGDGARTAAKAVGGAQSLQKHTDDTFPSSSSSNPSYYFDGRSQSSILPQSSNLNYQIFPHPLSLTLPHIGTHTLGYSINQGYQPADLMLRDSPVSIHSSPSTHYLPAIIPDTSLHHQHLMNHAIYLPQVKVPSSGNMHMFTIPTQNVQLHNPVLLDFTNKYHFLEGYFDELNKPAEIANSVHDHITLIDADNSSFFSNRRKVPIKNNIKYSCKLCGRIFSRKCDAVRHVQMHLGIRPYICRVCGKRFIQRSALIIHLRVHTGEKPYNCSKCGRDFSDPSSLIKHRYTHQRYAIINAERKKDLRYQTSTTKDSTNSHDLNQS